MSVALPWIVTWACPVIVTFCPSISNGCVALSEPAFWVAKAGGFQITKAQGKPSTAADVQLTTNYWREPAAGSDARAITVLDADNGKLYDEKIERLGQKELTVAGQQVTANGYHLKGKLDVELWFDAQGLLVRQSGKEDGHPTEVRLASVQQSSPTRNGKER